MDWSILIKTFKTLQDKYLNLLLDHSIRGAISKVMGNRFVKSDERKEILYFDAVNLYGHSRNQMLLYDEIEIKHGHPDLYMNKIVKKFEYSRL